MGDKDTRGQETANRNGGLQVGTSAGLPCPDCDDEMMEVTKHPDREQWGYYHQCKLTGNSHLDFRDTQQELKEKLEDRKTMGRYLKNCLTAEIL